MRKAYIIHKFTILELLIVISIIIILAGLLLPALNAARGKAKQIQCVSNLKNMNMALIQYANDNGEYLPTSLESNGKQGYTGALYPYLDRSGYVQPIYFARENGNFHVGLRKEKTHGTIFCPEAGLNNPIWKGTTTPKSYPSNYIPPDATLDDAAKLSADRIKRFWLVRVLNQPFQAVLLSRLKTDAILLTEGNYYDVTADATAIATTTVGLIPTQFGNYPSASLSEAGKKTVAWNLHSRKANFSFLNGSCRTLTYRPDNILNTNTFQVK